MSERMFVDGTARVDQMLADKSTAEAVKELQKKAEEADKLFSK